jgi:hypothetical protein
MTLGNMREQGVHHPIGSCINDACERNLRPPVTGITRLPAEKH